MMKPQISQRQLAKLAGVSPMTVSLALRGHASISEETRARIRALADEHGYRPDPALAALNAYRVRNSRASYHGTIGWLTGFPTHGGWRSLIQAEGYFEGAQKRAEELGYGLEEFWARDPALTPKRMTQILLSRGVRGLIVAPLPAGVAELSLGWENFCAVSLGYQLKNPSLHVVMNNQFRNMKTVVQRLYKQGYRRIGMAMPSAKDKRVDHNYLAGYFVAMHDFPCDAAHMVPLLSDNFDRACFQEWMRQERPDAIVVAASTAYEVMEWLRDLNLRVPEDIGVAVASIPYGDKTISGIDENVPSIGAHAVDAVVGMIHRNEMGVPQRRFSMLLEGDWTEGKTSRCTEKTPARK